ncbi:hypothetical protein CR513_41435, partial [Mucuna pruriens]
MNNITPWSTDICNYIVTSKFPPKASRQYKEKLESDAKYYVWDDLYLWRLYSDQVICRCIPDFEIKDVHQFISAYERCQRAGMAISRRHEMPQ